MHDYYLLLIICGVIIIYYIYKKNTRKSGYVYFVEYNGMVKIGRAKDPQKRFKQFKTTMPYMKVIKTIKTNDMYELEKKLHAKYKPYKITAEWYSKKVLKKI